MYTDHYQFKEKEGQQVRNMTESQMMNNLNFSIEDLLSKISKVTH